MTVSVVATFSQTIFQALSFGLLLLLPPIAKNLQVLQAIASCS